MTLENLLQPIVESAQSLVVSLRSGTDGESLDRQDLSPRSLGLRRAARLPILAALHAELQRPILLLTDRTDRALSLMDELALLAPAALRQYFPEPTPLFYENAPWGEATTPH